MSTPTTMKAVVIQGPKQVDHSGPIPKYDFVLGHEFVSEVYETGDSIKNWRKGDKAATALNLIMLLMANIFPTSYFVANNAYTMLNEAKQKDTITVMIRCDPVGLCAITAACSFFKMVYTIDSVPECLAEVKKHGAIPLHLTNNDPVKTVKEATEGCGTDIALEVVGAGLNLYNKNLYFQFGCCPVQAVFDPAIKLLSKHHDLFRSFIQHTQPIEDALEYYKLFNQHKVLKTIFEMNHAN
ncbi:hypothetical protein [Sporisorium scitamineum]|uniref:Alcohol dehydrogenase-like C-terminal domain-containing protein n=1 Tax=Sporisorium scitamineum TaxID=49012 RepID=A0A0F7S378_9BASI|nr:hypothetical protein [Sporisorium scitamineum]